MDVYIVLKSEPYSFEIFQTLILQKQFLLIIF